MRKGARNYISVFFSVVHKSKRAKNDVLSGALAYVTIYSNIKLVITLLM